MDDYERKQQFTVCNVPQFRVDFQHSNPFKLILHKNIDWYDNTNK